MLPNTTTQKGFVAPLKPTVENRKNQLVVVYNSRLDAIVNQMIVSTTEIKVTDMTTDWSRFVHDLSTKMFDKISL